MVGALVFSPTDTASQEPVVGSVQRVVVARVRASRDAAVQHCLEYLGSLQDVELEGRAQSVVQFEGVLLEAVPCVAYASVDLDGQVGIVVDVSPELYKLVRLVVHLARCLYAECSGGILHDIKKAKYVGNNSTSTGKISTCVQSLVSKTYFSLVPLQ